MQAPAAQVMSAEALDRAPGLIIRQDMQVGEAILQSIGIPYESANKYTVSVLPDGRHAVKVHGEEGAWQPTYDELKQMPPHMRVIEDSSWFQRVLLMACGCGNLRALKLHYYLNGGAEAFTSDRPFKCGAWLCCPLETTMVETASGRVLGRAVEDCDPCCGRFAQACCLWTFFTKVMDATKGAETHKYTLRTGLGCCGRVNNCCGATCCKPDLIIDVLDANGNLAATIQKTYGGGDGCGAFCRCVFEADNFIVEFPADASATDKALLMNALFHIEYELFEKTGDDDN